MSEEMQPIHPVTAALIMGKTPDPCEPMIEIPCKVLTRLMDVVEFGDQLERVEKDRLLANLKDMLAEEQPELWVIHSVGPNELHPMISKEAAEQHAAELAEMFKDMSNKYGCRFDVIRSPFSPLEHFEILAEETIEHRNDLMEYVKELEQKAAAAVVNQQLTTAGPTNAHGLDADYFIKLCAREFNPDVIRNQNPKDLARAFARAARTACAEVLKEREFQQVVLVVADLNLTTAARDVLAERQRQVTAEDWTPEHDDEHNGGELAAAAAAYSLHAADHLHPYSQGDGGNEAPDCWPWHNEIAGRGEGPVKTEPAWWKPGAPRRNLEKAGALILAEIERLDRAKQANQQESQP